MTESIDTGIELIEFIEDNPLIAQVWNHIYPYNGPPTNWTWSLIKEVVKDDYERALYKEGNLGHEDLGLLDRLLQIIDLAIHDNWIVPITFDRAYNYSLYTKRGSFFIKLGREDDKVRLYLTLSNTLIIYSEYLFSKKGSSLTYDLPDTPVL